MLTFDLPWYFASLMFDSRLPPFLKSMNDNIQDYHNEHFHDYFEQTSSMMRLIDFLEEYLVILPILQFFENFSPLVLIL